MKDRLKFYLSRISERLWVKPLLMCLFSITGAFVAKMADYVNITRNVPEITPGSIETLLTIISSSMLVIATLAVASMVSAYASASNVTTPRSFSLVVSDDVSQNALSTFIGAFIFSIVALMTLKNNYYDVAGRFALFILTLIVFTIVILTFIRWVDRIARLGRLGATTDKIEAATTAALRQRRRTPTLGGIPVTPQQDESKAICGDTIGYIQRVDVIALQKYAVKSGLRIQVEALPGMFMTPGRALAYVASDTGDCADMDESQIIKAFVIGNDRTFEEDPRFGLIVLSEIASRALSPAVNDPGTAIDVIGTLVRLFTFWGNPIEEDEQKTSECDRISVPEISLNDMFDDAFRTIARDGAGSIEVMIWLLKALESLSLLDNAPMREAAISHARETVARAETALKLPKDLEILMYTAKFADKD